ncbi:Inner membrane protein YbiR [Candidatus Nitrosocosmicus oleophilus]|uniref:Inner membrane protein YbiR n=1 Tax=Candidatus Nitrosocosmicus oleophilus TaxID=1353260 RepID=A0A654M5A5_9ARCH|nr:ArsB/NhaD family transporter [Candidatus Nitrosocosmicus oleophilus]ALI37881.1 Inner membrane protein YbiR [Candidatus Nitrosocosmicus oleophilus]
MIYIVLIFTIPLLVFEKSVTPILAGITIIMIAIYVLLGLDIIHRTVIAMFAAIVSIILAIALGSFLAEESLDFVIESIDFNTIGLLLGMMIMVAILGETGVFHQVGIKLGKISKGNVWILMLLLCTFTSVASMFVDNVTTILLMVPVTLSITRTLGIHPIPFIIAQVLVSNIGGAATLIGDPPNILIGSAAGIDFNSFLKYMGPTIAIIFGFSLLLIKIFFKRELKGEQKLEQQEDIQELMHRDENAILIHHKGLLVKCLIVLVGVIILFSLQTITHLEVSIIAIGGAAILLIVSRVPPEKILHEVDWATLLFFIGLFVIVGVAVHAGLITILANMAIDITGGDPWITFVMVIWMSGITSAFVDNIPLTTTMIPLVHSLNGDPTIADSFGPESGFQFSPLWWALALGADLGGNGTLIGSSAGVVAIALSAKFGHYISFTRWIKIGFPFMLITLGIGTIVLYGFLMLMY